MTSLGDPTVLTYTTEEVKAEIALKSVLEQIKRVTSEDPIVSVIPESDLPPESRSAEIPIHTRLFQEMRERKAETIQAFKQGKVAQGVTYEPGIHGGHPQSSLRQFMTKEEDTKIPAKMNVDELLHNPPPLKSLVPAPVADHEAKVHQSRAGVMKQPTNYFNWASEAVRRWS